MCSRSVDSFQVAATNHSHVFVGSARLAEVEDLLSRFTTAQTNVAPAMVAYVAPPGWGKTRIIQEFYRRLAAQQPRPPYWPAALVATPDGADTTFVGLTTGRKTVRPRLGEMPAGGQIPWLWLAPPSARLGDGSCAPALDHVAADLAWHLPALLGDAFAEGTVDEHDELLTALAAAVPFASALELTRSRPELMHRLVDRYRPAGADGAADRGSGLAMLLRLVLRRRPIGVVIVLDDAHDLDVATVNFVAEVLSGDLPVLFVATTWPDPPVHDAAPSPFTGFLTDTASAERVIRIELGQLTVDDLVAYLLDQFPGTDEHVAAGLVERSGRNPYALRLLLDTPRLREAVRGGRIELHPGEISGLEGGLDGLLRNHWAQLDVGVKQTLAAAAMLGQSFLDDVLVAALGAVQNAASNGGLDAAYASAWIRPAGEPERLVEFIERIRYDLARDAAADVLSEKVRRMVLDDALRVVRQLLDDGSPEVRRNLLALHVGLARDGVEPELSAAARSARELAELARSQHRRPEAIGYLTEAVRWVEGDGAKDHELLVDCILELTGAVQAEYTLKESEPYARRAFEIARDYLPADDERQVHTRLSLARSLMRRSEPDSYQAAAAMIAEAEAMIGAAPSVELLRRLWQVQKQWASNQGDYATARARSAAIVKLSEAHFGPLHRLTYAALEDLGYHTMRCGDLAGAIEVRSEALRRQIELIPVAGLLPTAPARNNLAASLMRLPGGERLDEAEQLAEDALSIWARVYGIGGRRPLRARLIRARVWQLQGLRLEAAGEEPAAVAKFRRAAAETMAVLAARENAAAGSRAIALTRHGTSLAALRDAEGIQLLTTALRIRRKELRQDETYWPMQEAVQLLAWAYRRFGLHREAASTLRSHKIEEA